MNAHESLAADLALYHADPTGSGEAVTLVPAAGGSSVALRGTLARQGITEEEFPDGQYELQLAELYLSGVASVTILPEDTFTVAAPGGTGTETWRIRKLGVLGAGTRQILLVRQQRKALIGSGDQYQRGRGKGPMGMA